MLEMPRGGLLSTSDHGRSWHDVLPATISQRVAEARRSGFVVASVLRRPDLTSLFHGIHAAEVSKDAKVAFP